MLPAMTNIDGRFRGWEGEFGKVTDRDDASSIGRRKLPVACVFAVLATGGKTEHEASRCQSAGMAA